MDETLPDIKVDHINHLGIICAIIKKYNLTDTINNLLPKISNSQKLTHGEVVIAMIYQGLGISDSRAYMGEKFFQNLPIEKLFRAGITTDMFKKDTYARTLDAIYKYGINKFFCDVAFITLSEHNLVSSLLRMDSTSFSQGSKKSKWYDDIRICHGHSKDHRSDLPQLVQLLVTTNAGLPLWSRSYSGNTNDKEIFEPTIVEIQQYFKKMLIKDDFTFVADSALYSKKFLLNKDIKSDWITRIPKSISKAKSALQRNYCSILWTKIDKNYKYIELVETYAGVKQRWLLVRNRKAKYKQLATLKKNLTKDELLIEKAINRIQKKIFYSSEEINLEIKKLQERYKYFIFKKKIYGAYKSQRGIKRKLKVGYRPTISVKRDDIKIKLEENKKGRFIIGTNILCENTLSAKELLQKYRGQPAEIESCFRFMKDSTYKLNSIFQTKPERIFAMMQVTSLILFVNNLGQRDLRQDLAGKANSIPNQLGKGTVNPTLKWAFQLMRKVTRVRVKISGKIFEQYKGIEDAQKIVIEAFGHHAKSIYGFP